MYHEASRFLGATLLRPNSQESALCFSIDSRGIFPGECFVALKGAQTDGHDYLDDAFRFKASGVIIDASFYQKNKERILDPQKPYQNLLVVPDTQKAFVALAEWHFLKIRPITVAITGSVGKTSTKEFLNYLLNLKIPSFATPGNWNNELGLSLTFSRLEPAHRFFIAEVGANHPGEIRNLTRRFCHRGAVITQVAPSHLEGFGSLEAIYLAKLEVLDHMDEDGVLVVWDEDLKLIEMARQRHSKVVLVGEKDTSDYRISQINEEGGWVNFRFKGKLFSFPSRAKFLVQNAALALAMADLLGVSWTEVPERWQDLKLPAGRFQITEIEGVTFIDDSYNASPKSFAKAVESFSELRVAGNKYLVIADMLELGTHASDLHRELGRIIAQYDLAEVLVYGDAAKKTADEILKAGKTNVFYDEGGQKIAAHLFSKLRSKDAVLFKASHGMKMGRIIRAVEDFWIKNKSAQSRILV